MEIKLLLSALPSQSVAQIPIPHSSPRTNLREERGIPQSSSERHDSSPPSPPLHHTAPRCDGETCFLGDEQNILSTVLNLHDLSAKSGSCGVNDQGARDVAIKEVQQTQFQNDELMGKKRENERVRQRTKGAKWDPK